MAKQRPVFYNLAQRICAERLAPFSKASIALLLSIAATVAACRDDSGSTMREEIGKLREEVLALKQLHYEVLNMQNEISALKARQQKDTTAAESPIKPAAFTPDGSHKDDPFLGPKDAAVVLMAFSDFQCRPCQKFFLESFPLLKTDFIDHGKLKFIYRDFPVGSHLHAKRAAQLAHCAGEQGLYWPMFSLLSENRLELEAGHVEAIAAKLAQANQEKLAKCLQSTKYEREIERDAAEGKSIGAKGAPGFFAGREGPDGELRGVFIRGAQPYPVLKAEIEKLLAIEPATK